MFLARKMQRGLAIPITASGHPDLLFKHTADNISGGTTFDDSLKGNDGTITGATTATGKVGNAFSFDGVNDKIVIPDFTVSGSGCLCLWSMNSGDGVNRFFLTRHNPSGAYSHFTFMKQSDNKFNIRIVRSGYSKFITTNNAFTAADHFVRFQSDGSNYKIFVNETDEAFTVTGTDAVDDGDWLDVVADNGAREFSMQAVVEAGSTFYGSGDQDQMLLFNRALTTSEGADIYNGGSGV